MVHARVENFIFISATHPGPDILDASCRLIPIEDGRYDDISARGSMQHRPQLIRGPPEPALESATFKPSRIKLKIMASTKKWSTELKDTGYITKEDLEAKLKEVFESKGYEPEDFKIAVRVQLVSLRLASTQFTDSLNRPETRDGLTMHPGS